MSNNKSIKLVDEYGNIRYVNEKGLYHREDGPAIERPTGYKEWYINGLRHREDGSAIIYPNGDEDYFLYNIEYSREDWEEEVVKLKLGRIKDL